MNRLRIHGIGTPERVPAHLEKGPLDGGSSCATDVTQVNGPGHPVEKERFEWAEVRRGFMDPQVWLIGFAAIAATVPILSLGFFL